MKDFYCSYFILLLSTFLLKTNKRPLQLDRKSLVRNGMAKPVNRLLANK
jgi:hypothetical protein